MTETLITRFILDDSRYKSGGAGVLSVTKAIDNAIARTQANAARMASGIGHAIGRAVRGAAIGVAGLGASVVGLSLYAMRAAADMDSLKRALTAVAGSSAEAERQFASLKALADRSPVLDIESAIRGSIGLQSTGQFTAAEAERIMASISNAIAISGGNIEGFSRVMENLKQIASQGKLTGDELRETAAQIPALRKAMLAVFGTTNAGELGNIAGADIIKLLAAELEKLPAVGGGVQTAFDNLGSSIKIAFATIGNVINANVVPVIQKITGAIDWLVNSGVLERLTASIMQAFDWNAIGDMFLRGLSWVIALVQNLPGIMLRVGVSVRAVFEWLADSASILGATLGAIFLGPTLVRGVMQLVTAFNLLKTAIQSAGLMAVLMTSIATAGRNLIGVALGLATGLATVAGIIAVLKAQLPDAPQLGNLMGLSGVGIDATRIYNEIQKALGGGAPPDTVEKPPLVAPVNTVEKIESNTRRTADATQKLVERFEQTIFGGSELGRHGLTARDITSIRRGGSGGGGFEAQIEEATRIITSAILGLQSRTLKAG